MINPYHLHDYVVVPVLQTLDMDSSAARALVMGTAAKESGLRHLVQLGDGPARGLWQMEPATHDDIWSAWVFYHPLIRSKLSTLCVEGSADELTWNLRYACAMCRLHYRRISKPLPAAGDAQGLAAYWKRYYNTELGKGTEDEFVHSFRLVENTLNRKVTSP